MKKMKQGHDKTGFKVSEERVLQLEGGSTIREMECMYGMYVYMFQYSFIYN